MVPRHWMCGFTMNSSDSTETIPPLPNWYEMLEITHPELQVSARIHRSQDPDDYYATVVDLKNMWAIAFKNAIHKSQVYFCVNMVSPPVITFEPPTVEPTITITECSQEWSGNNLAYDIYTQAGACVSEIQYEFQCGNFSHELAVLTLSAADTGFDPCMN